MTVCHTSTGVHGKYEKGWLVQELSAKKMMREKYCIIRGENNFKECNQRNQEMVKRARENLEQCWWN